MKDFLVFQRMITPTLIQIVYWIGTFIIFFAGLGMFLVGDGTLERIFGLLMMILGPLTIRIYAELFILLFKMNDTLTEIKNNTERNQSP